MKLVRGDRLNQDQRKLVLSMYVYRWTIENDRRAMAYGKCPCCKVDGGEPSPDRVDCRQYHPTVELQSDEAWLADQSFWVKVDGTMARRNSEPAFMADRELPAYMTGS